MSLVHAIKSPSDYPWTPIDFWRTDLVCGSRLWARRASVEKPTTFPSLTEACCCGSASLVEVCHHHTTQEVSCLPLHCWGVPPRQDDSGSVRKAINASPLTWCGSVWFVVLQRLFWGATFSPVSVLGLCHFGAISTRAGLWTRKQHWSSWRAESP